MALLWWEIGLIVAFNTAILAGIGLIAVRFLRKYVPMWAGGAIGRFWTTLSEKAGEEGGAPGSSVIELGGLKVDPAAIQQIVAIIPQIVQGIEMIQSLGFLKGGGGGTFKP